MTDTRTTSSREQMRAAVMGVFLMILAGAPVPGVAVGIATTSAQVDTVSAQLKPRTFPEDESPVISGVSAQSASNNPPPSDRLVFTIAAGVSALFVIGMGVISYLRRKQADKDVVPEPEFVESSREEMKDSEKIPVLVDETQDIQYVLSHGTTTAGRHSDNDISVTDASVSRHHAEFTQGKSGGGFIVTDLDSMNGVYVNDEQVSSSKLKDGDTVELGDLTLRFRLLDELTDAGGEVEVTQEMAGPRGRQGEADLSQGPRRVIIIRPCLRIGPCLIAGRPSLRL